MKNILKKAGWICLTILPTIISLLVQGGTGILFTLICMAIATARVGGADSPANILAITQLTQEMSMKYIGLVLLGYHLFAIVLFGIWYYFGCGRPKISNPARIFHKNNVLTSVVLALGLCIFANGLVLVGQYVVPTAIEEYTQMMEAAGLGVDFFSIITSILIAPIGEEIVCRGLTYHYAKKVVADMKNRRVAFWIANALQALMFGVMHGNLVQGSYAFILGMGLGWLRERYNSLYPAMLAHAAINFSSTFIVGYPISLLPENVVSYSILTLVGILLTAMGYLFGRAPGKACLANESLQG